MKKITQTLILRIKTILIQLNIDTDILLIAADLFQAFLSENNCNNYFVVFLKIIDLLLKSINKKR